MRRVAQRDTPPELFVRKYLFARGFRFRKNLGLSQARPILFSQSIRPSFLCMGVFGTNIRRVQNRNAQNQTKAIGTRSWMAISPETDAKIKNFEGSDGG